MANRYRAGGLGYGTVKAALVQKIDQHFSTARERRKELAKRPDEVEDILRAGARRAREEAQKTMELVRSACGLR
jgi:tryptophanyl-tRNA synthetase